MATERADLRYPAQPFLARVRGIATLKCPVCLDGRMFQSAWRLYDKCATCGHHFMPAVGIARVGQFMVCTVPTLAAAVAAFFGTVRLAEITLPSQVGVEPVVLAALSLECAFVPMVQRYLRAAWEHLRLPTRR